MRAPPPASWDSRWQLLLERLVIRCASQVEVENVAIGIATDGRQWAPGGASSTVAARLDELSFTLGEGPGPDALREHTRAQAADLESNEVMARWPAWASAATRLGVRAAIALPVEAGAITVGVVSLYPTRPGRLTVAQLAAARRTVDAALLVLLDMAASFEEPADGEASDSLSVLLRADVHRAAGMVMMQADLPIDQALVRLRAHAFATGRRLPEVAADVLARRVHFGREEDQAK